MPDTIDKRAEELAAKLFEMLGPDWILGKEFRDSTIALIDAELRKERERCAEIINGLPETYMDGNGYAFVNVDYMPHEMKSAAIDASLAEEED